MIDKSNFGKYKEYILYIFFGGMTTVVSILSYWIAYYVLFFGNIISNIVSWFLSVLFAFLTNKFYVFESRGDFKTTIRELLSFFACRFSTGLIETAVMILFVDIWKMTAMIVKVFVTLAVIIANYFLSKKMVFMKKN